MIISAGVQEEHVRARDASRLAPDGTISVFPQVCSAVLTLDNLIYLSLIRLKLSPAKENVAEKENLNWRSGL